MVVKRLTPPIPLDTPRGHALAYFAIFEGRDHDIKWVCVIEETLEFWTVRGPEVRLLWNWTEGLGRKPEHKFPMQPKGKTEVKER